MKNQLVTKEIREIGMSKRLLKIYYGMSACGVIIGGLALTRSYLNGSKYEGTEELYGKTVIITGANRGIGKETARDLAKRGCLSLFVFQVNM